MKNVLKGGLTAIMLLLGVSVVVASSFAKRDFKKEYKKEFDIDKDGEVWLVNKHGDVNISTWDKGKVKIKATITVYTNNEGQAEEYLRKVYVKSTTSSDYYKAETIQEKTKKRWYDWTTNKSNFSYRVDYEISIPKSVTLYVSNRHGDVFVEEMYGRTKATVIHGNIKMKKANTSLNITVAYGDAFLTEMGDGDINIKHGKLNIEQARDVKINSKNSRVFIKSAADLNIISKNDYYEIEDISDLRSSSKYDNFKIKELKSVYINARFSDYTITKLLESAEFEVEHTDANIENLDKDFDKIKFNGKSSDLIVNLSGTNADIEIFAKQTTIDIPKSTRLKVDKEVNMQRELVGNIGGNTKGLIKATTESGKIKIKK